MGELFQSLLCRRHVDVFVPVLNQAILQSGYSLQEIDLISVARGPGLIGPLLIGIHAAEALSWALKKPLIGINHIEAHLYAALMSSRECRFPLFGSCSFRRSHSTCSDARDRKLPVNRRDSR